MVKLRGATKFFIGELFSAWGLRGKRTREIAAGTHAPGVAAHTTGPA